MAFSGRAILGAGGIVASVSLLSAVVFTPAFAGAGSASLTPGGCTATATVDAEWGSGAAGGQVLRVRVVNTSAVEAARWSVTWTLGAGQRIASSWNATTTVTDHSVTATNTPYNATIAPGGSTTFGVQVDGTGPAPVATCDNGVTVPTSPESSSTSAVDADVNVTTADVLKTVTLQVGQTLGVSLPANFRQPKASGDALTVVSATGGFPTGQPVRTVFRASSVGSVDVAATLSCSSDPTPCPGPLWLVHVKVLSSTPTGTGQTVTVTAADHTRTVTLNVGDTLVVTLARDYVSPKVTPAGVLAAQSVVGGYPTGQTLSATYQAVASGKADVSTFTDIACFHEPTPCPSPSIPWVVHVIVA